LEEEKRGDVFSFGMILWELINQKRAWEGKSIEDIKESVLNGKKLPNVRDLGKEAILIMLNDLMNECLQSDWKKRPSFQIISEKLASCR